MSKYYYNKDYFRTIDTQDKAYWLGFLYADGCINTLYKNDKLKTMNLEISLSSKDKNHLQKFLDCLESNIVIHDSVAKCNDKEYARSRINVCCKKLCYDLINLKCIPNKTYGIRLPSYDIVPKKFMRDFLRGFFDGDGCIHMSEYNNTKTTVLILTGTFNMLQDISNYLLSENIIRKIPKIIKDDRRKYTYSLRFNGYDTNKEILDYLYKDSNIYLDRKYEQYIEYYKNYKDIDKRGVYWSKRNKAYVVTIRINGERIRVGQFKDLNEAIEARKDAEIKKMKLNKPT